MEKSCGRQHRQGTRCSSCHPSFDGDRVLPLSHVSANSMTGWPCCVASFSMHAFLHLLCRNIQDCHAESCRQTLSEDHCSSCRYEAANKSTHPDEGHQQPERDGLNFPRFSARLCMISSFDATRIPCLDGVHHARQLPRRNACCN